MIELYKSIQKLLNELDFNALYPGFKQYKFALYNKHQVQFVDQIIAVDQRFVGNTAIKYNEEYLAIWNIEDTPYDEIVLTSKIVHEMFHAWQYDNFETRFPNEFKALSYQYNQENLGMKITETLLLLKGFKANDFQCIQQFFSLREKRKEIYHKEVAYESAIETVEGMARFVEIKVLEQLDQSRYLNSLEKTYKYLEQSKNYLPIRMISYEIGMLILLFAEKAKINFNHDIGKTTKYTYDFVFSEIEKVDYHFETDLDFTFLEEYKQNIRELIKNILSSNPKKLNVNKIIGFNPLGSFKIGNKIYFNYFVIVEYDNQERFIMNDCVGFVNEDGQVYQLIEYKNNK